MGVAGDHRRVDLAGEVALDLLRHLHREVGARVVHREQHALQLDAGVQRALDDAHGVEQVAQALQRKILRLHRHQQRVRRAQGVQRQQLQRRRAVDEDEVVVGGEGRERVLEQKLPPVAPDHLNARARQRLAGRQHVAVASMHHGLFRVRAVDDHLVHALRRGLVHAHAGGGVRLRVEVAQQHALARLIQRRDKVDTSGRLADAALLIYDRYGLRQANPRFPFENPIFRHFTHFIFSRDIVYHKVEGFQPQIKKSGRYAEKHRAKARCFSLPYQIISGPPPKPSEAGSVGKEDAAERTSFRACAEASDTELAATCFT